MNIYVTMSGKAILVNGEAIIVPPEKPYYCEVEYLYTGDDINCGSSSPFTSTSYRLIDTNKTIDLTSVVEIKFAFDKNIYFSGCGARNNSSNMTQSIYFPAAYSTQNKFGWTIGSGEDQRQKFDLDTNVHTIRVDLPNSNVVWDNVNYPIENLTYTPSSRTFPLFAFSDVRATQENGYRFPMQGKIYYAKFWKNGVLTKHLVPVLDWNMTPCMYDKVSGQLFYNQGTGDFIAGREIHPVDYLESTGTQYIDTGIQPTDDYGYKIKNTYTRGGGEQCAIGCMDSGNRFVGIYTSGAQNQLSGAWGSFVGFLSTYSWDTGDILDVEVNYKNSRKMIVGDTELKDISDIHITGTISNSIYIGARHYGSNVTKMQGKIYGVEITNNQNVIADFIPAIDENGVGFMFDRVTHTIFDNAGAGDFLYGERV